MELLWQVLILVVPTNTIFVLLYTGKIGSLYDAVLVSWWYSQTISVQFFILLFGSNTHCFTEEIYPGQLKLSNVKDCPNSMISGVAAISLASEGATARSKKNTTCKVKSSKTDLSS